MVWTQKDNISEHFIASPERDQVVIVLPKGNKYFLKPIQEKFLKLDSNYFTNILGKDNIVSVGYRDFTQLG